MNFGPQLSLFDSQKTIIPFLDGGYNAIDAAYVYNGGDTERIIGEIGSEIDLSHCSIATKVNPRITGKLDEASITSQLEESLGRMKIKSCDLMYLHFPDPSTNLEETLHACAKLHSKGLFKKLGLSNYPAWEVVEAWHVCKSNDWPVPSVYQGLYNPLSRQVEVELLPALRRLGMSFYAYNPLAGGILAGKYKDFSKDPNSGRFAVRPNYRNRYWKESYFDAIKLLEEKSMDDGMSLIEATFRWLVHHSSLNVVAGDGILLGVSKPSQLTQNLEMVKGGHLSAELLETFENAWLFAKPDCPNYFRLPD